MSPSRSRDWTYSHFWLKTAFPRPPTMTFSQSSVTMALQAVSRQISLLLAHTSVPHSLSTGYICHLEYILGVCSSESFFSLIPGGHYIAYCRNDENNLWYEFDDHRVTEVSESCVQNAEAYVLFYKYANFLYLCSKCNEMCESSKNGHVTTLSCTILSDI